MTLPPFTYYGGKQRLADRIVQLLPAHRHYVEPFAGSLAVLLAKPRARMETVNDLDGDLVTFWRVLRDQPDELAERMALTPHSRAEHTASFDLDVDDDVERARRVWVRLSQGRGGLLRQTGWRHFRDPAGSGTGMPEYLAGYARRVPACAERLAGVSIECRDAHDLIRDYGAHRDVLLYVDPPYLGSTRGWGNQYRHELRTVEQHDRLADVLHACRASVVLSGYDSDLYRDRYDAAGWHRVELKASTGNGRTADGEWQGDRVEVLWSNRPIGDPVLFEVADVGTAT